MKAIPFDPKKDLAPLPVEAGHVELAKELKRLGIEDKEIADIWTSGRTMNPGDELQAVYEKLADALRHPRS
jgi:hypothetical protein